MPLELLPIRLEMKSGDVRDRAARSMVPGDPFRIGQRHLSRTGRKDERGVKDVLGRISQVHHQSDGLSRACGDKNTERKRDNAEHKQESSQVKISRGKKNRRETKGEMQERARANQHLALGILPANLFDDAKPYGTPAFRSINGQGLNLT